MAKIAEDLDQGHCHTDVYHRGRRHTGQHRLTQRPGDAQQEPSKPFCRDQGGDPLQRLAASHALYCIADDRGQCQLTRAPAHARRLGCGISKGKTKIRPSSKRTPRKRRTRSDPAASPGLHRLRRRHVRLNPSVIPSQRLQGVSIPSWPASRRNRPSLPGRARRIPQCNN